MDLPEIAEGEKTSDVTLAKAVDIAQQIRKTPIVVNDSRGFFTSRVIGKFLDEAIAMSAKAFRRRRSSRRPFRLDTRRAHCSSSTS